MTSKGSIEVQEFIPSINVGMFTPYDGDVRVVDRYGNDKTIESTFFDEVHTTIKIELSNGDIIEVTEEHLFPVIRNGMEVCVMAKDLLESDDIIEV